MQKDLIDDHEAFVQKVIMSLLQKWTILDLKVGPGLRTLKAKELVADARAIASAYRESLRRVEDRGSVCVQASTIRELDAPPSRSLLERMYPRKK